MTSTGGPEPEAADGVTVAELGGGVVRVGWSATLQSQGFESASLVVRAHVEALLGHSASAASAASAGVVGVVSRVEAEVDPTDPLATRIATWSGLQREGVRRGVVPAGPGSADRVVFARIAGDESVHSGRGFRAVLNSFLPRKRAIAQMLIRDTDGRVLLCNLTYKADWDLPGGVVEVGESPRLAVTREIAEELALRLPAGRLALTDWLPAWSGWDDALCLVFDGGTHPVDLQEQIVAQAREIQGARFCSLAEVHTLCADFTARRIDSAVHNLDHPEQAVTFTESGRPLR